DRTWVQLGACFVAQRRPASSPESGPREGGASATTGTAQSARRVGLQFAAMTTGPTCGLRRLSTCWINDWPARSSRNFSPPPIRRDWPPASTTAAVIPSLAAIVHPRTELRCTARYDDHVV